MQSPEWIGVITHIAGSGGRGFNGDGQHGNLTSLSYPTGLAVDDCGNVKVADLGNSRIRELQMNTSCPARPVLTAAPPPNPASGGFPLGLVVLLAAAIAVGIIIGTRIAARKGP